MTKPDIDPAQLKELEQAAIDAWLDEGDTIAEELAGRAFVERVVSADESRPLLFAVEDLPPEPEPPRPRRWAAGLRFAATMAAAAGFAIAAYQFVPGPGSRPDEGDLVGVAVPESTSFDVTRPQVGGLGLPADGTPGAPIPADLARDIKDYIGGYGKHWGPAFAFHGSILVARDGDVVYSRGFGLSNTELERPNTPQTRYRLGLLTEQFTAAAILQLRDGGVLELDDPISKYLPEYPAGNRITIEHLLSHTSGIPNYTDFTYFQTWKSQPHTTAAMLGRFAEVPLAFEPGTDFRPTNSGYYVLGAIIERITGRTYGEYVQEHILDPIGMFKTSFGDASTPDQARGNVWNDEEVLDPPDDIDMSVFGGAGGLVSTPLDLMRFDEALYSGEVLAVTSVEEMATDNGNGYGYGWIIDQAYGQPVMSFPGAIDGFNGSMLRFTDDRTLIVVLCNTEVIPGGTVALDVARMVYGDVVVPRQEHPEVDIDPGSFANYAGTYNLTKETRDRYAMLVVPERLNLLRRVYVRQVGDRLYFDVPGHGHTWMHPMGDDQFFFKDHAGSVVSFARVADERATALRVHYQDAAFVLERASDASSQARSPAP